MAIFPRELAEYVKSLLFLGRFDCPRKELTAGAFEELVITYEVGAAALADGAWLKLVFKFYSDWGLFQVTHPDRANYLTATYVPRAEFPGESPATVRALKVRFDQKGHERPYQKAIIIDVVDGYLKPGDKIEIRLGDRRSGGPGTRVQTFAESSFHFRGFVDTVGASRFARVPGDVTLSILAGAPARGVLLTPRLVRPGIRFPVTYRLEDTWGNLALPQAARPPQVSIFQDGKAVAENAATWRDRQGAWTRMEFNVSEPGGYEIIATPFDTRASLTVAPDAPEPRALFADLHIHSEDTVGVNTTREVLSFARDAAGLDVAGYTANDFNVRADRWAEAVAICRELHRPGSFLCLSGTEWCGSSAIGGDRNVIFLSDEVRFPLDQNGRSLRVFDWNEDTPKGKTQEAQLWPASALHDAYRDMGEKVLLIPHVGGRRAIFDWHDPELERLVEVASSWGHFDWFYRDALARGLQVGASAAGDEHRGRPGGGAPGVGSFGVYGGVTGVLASELTSEAIGRALRARHTWATTSMRSVALLSSKGRRQGDTFEHRGELEVTYQLFGDAGWERVELRDDQGALLLVRDLDMEMGYAPNRFRVRWGGARVRDRYRWAEWHGRISITGTSVLSEKSGGLEHVEERVVKESEGIYRVRTDTYGDADWADFEVENLAAAQIKLDFEIDAYNKTGPVLERNLDPVTPGTSYGVKGADLLARGSLRHELGGAELFLAVERLTDKALPRRLEGKQTLKLENGPHGFRGVYLFGRERSDAKVWTSPLFVRLT